MQNSLTGSSEPSISSDGKVLTWVFENIDLGTWIEIDYSVSVNEIIITHPSVNNSVVIEVIDPENPDTSVTISKADNIKSINGKIPSIKTSGGILPFFLSKYKKERKRRKK